MSPFDYYRVTLSIKNQETGYRYDTQSIQLAPGDYGGIAPGAVLPAYLAHARDENHVIEQPWPEHRHL